MPPKPVGYAARTRTSKSARPPWIVLPRCGPRSPAGDAHGQRNAGRGVPAGAGDGRYDEDPVPEFACYGSSRLLAALARPPAREVLTVLCDIALPRKVTGRRAGSEVVTTTVSGATINCPPRRAQPSRPGGHDVVAATASQHTVWPARGTAARNWQSLHPSALANPLPTYQRVIAREQFRGWSLTAVSCTHGDMPVAWARVWVFAHRQGLVASLCLPGSAIGRCPMTTTPPCYVPVTVQPVFSESEWVALAGY